MAESGFDVVAVGEVMGLFDPESSGPLEDASRFRLRVAGAEGNVLINLAHLGHSTALVSAVGADPLGRLVTRTLADQGVNIEHVRINTTGRTGVFLKERLADGERRVYYYRDGSAASRLSPEELSLDRLGAPRILVLSGVTLGLGDGTGLSAVARKMLAWAAEEACTVVFDPNLRPTLWHGARAAEEFAEILPHIDVLLAGRDELAALVPTADPDDAARGLCEAGMTAVVLKDGARGAVVHDDNRSTRVAAYPVREVVDPVGAGDAFAAGVISGLLHGWSVLDGAKIGAVLGARAVTVSGDWESSATGDGAQHLLDEYLSTFDLMGGARMTDARATAEALYRAFLAGDKDGMLAVMDDDVEVSFLGQVHLRGKEAASEFFDFAATLLRDVEFTLEQIVVDGDVAAGIWRETATTLSGEPWANHGVDVIHVRGGRVVALHENNDVRMVRKHFPSYQAG